MIYTARIEKALQKAAVLHDGQYRRGNKKLPYISHPVSVMLLLSLYSAEEDLHVAALMHDCVEDTKYTFKQLESDFGKNVREIVAGVTEPKEQSGRILTRAEAKKAYVSNLRLAPEGSTLVAAADKINNFRSVVNEYGKDTRRYWRDFDGSRESKLLYYGEIVKIVVSRLDNPITDILVEAYTDFKKFLEN